MIAIRHKDGSESYEYEVGDRVTILKAIGGGMFSDAAAASLSCEVIRKDRHSDLSFFVRWSSEWGPAQCFRWDLRPTHETLAAAKVTYSYPVERSH